MIPPSHFRLSHHIPNMAVSVLFSKGEFSIPEEVELALFKQYPPHTAIGALFAKQDASKFSEDLKTLQDSETLHWGYLILDRRPICEGYQQLKVRTIYSYPLLTSDPESVQSSEISFWSSFLQNTAGEIFSHDLDDSETVRTCEALQKLLVDGGYMNQFGIQTVPDGHAWTIEEDVSGNEVVEIHWSMERILNELLAAVDPTRLPAVCLGVTRDLVAGRVRAGDIVA